VLYARNIVVKIPRKLFEQKVSSEVEVLKKRREGKNFCDVRVCPRRQITTARREAYPVPSTYLNFNFNSGDIEKQIKSLPTIFYDNFATILY